MKSTPEHQHTAQTPAIYDVIISGAGLVGLFLAAELALAKCSVLILERAQSPSSPLKQIPFGIRGLSAPTIEALDRRGLLHELEVHKRIKNPHQNAGQGARRQLGHFAGIPFHEGDVDSARWRYRLSSSTATSLISEMEELESVLARRAVSLGVDIRRGLALTALHQTAHGVKVQAGDRSLEGRWLVGCDGARSVVRKSAGFEFAGTEPEFTGYTMRVEIADPDKLKGGRNVTAEGMYLQSQPGYLAVQDFDGGAFHQSRNPVTLAHAQEVLRRVSGTDVTLTALHVASTWSDQARQATSYRNGRILLAGDAAHIHSPLGGQGLNLGIGDAMNLGWKLAATIHGTAPDALLDSYQDERYPIGAAVLDWSRAQVGIMRPDPHARALYAIMRDLMTTRDGATYIAGRVWGVDTHYDLDGDHPLVGHSVPDFEFEDGACIAGLMQDGRGLLLDFDMNAVFKALAGEYGDRINYASGGVKDSLGVSALLIRPDGIVSWAAGKDTDAGGLQTAAARWFGGNAEPSSPAG